MHWADGVQVHTVFGFPGQDSAVVCMHGGRLYPCATCGEAFYSCPHSLAHAACGQCRSSEAASSPAAPMHDPVIDMPGSSTPTPLPTAVSPAIQALPSPTPRTMDELRSSSPEHGGNSSGDATNDDDIELDDENDPTFESAPERRFYVPDTYNYRERNPTFSPPSWWDEDNEKEAVGHYYGVCLTLPLREEVVHPKPKDLVVDPTFCVVEGRRLVVPVIKVVKIRASPAGAGPDVVRKVKYPAACSHGKAIHRCRDCLAYLPCAAHHLPYSGCPSPQTCHRVCARHGIAVNTCPPCRKICSTSSLPMYRCTHCIAAENALPADTRALPLLPLSPTHVRPGRPYRFQDPVTGIYSLVRYTPALPTTTAQNSEQAAEEDSSPSEEVVRPHSTTTAHRRPASPVSSYALELAVDRAMARERARQAV